MPQVAVINRFIGLKERKMTKMKAIINGKVYDTETAELAAKGSYVEVFQTRKGNWFKRLELLGMGCRIIPIEQKEAMSLVGVLAPDQYGKFFGEAVEA